MTLLSHSRLALIPPISGRVVEKASVVDKNPIAALQTLRSSWRQGTFTLALASYNADAPSPTIAMVDARCRFLGV